MLERLLAKFRFDEAWYLAAYPDVQQAIERGLFTSAFDHYWKFGRAERRLPAEPVVDEQWYLSVYADVREGIARGEFADARQHFVKTGSREGRVPRPLHVQVILNQSKTGGE